MVTDHIQLELFADRSKTEGSSNAKITRGLDPGTMSGDALISALPNSMLADACALAAEAGEATARRRSECARSPMQLFRERVAHGSSLQQPGAPPGSLSDTATRTLP